MTFFSTIKSYSRFKKDWRSKNSNFKFLITHRNLMHFETHYKTCHKQYTTLFNWLNLTYNYKTSQSLLIVWISIIVSLYCCDVHVVDIAEIFALTKFSDEAFLKNKQQYLRHCVFTTIHRITLYRFVYWLYVLYVWHFDRLFRYIDVASCCSMMSFEMHQISMCDEEFEIRVSRSPTFFKTTVNENPSLLIATSFATRVGDLTTPRTLTLLT